MSKAKLMNDASVQRVTTVPAADLVNVVDNATGKVKAIEYNALLTQLRNDLLGGRVVGSQLDDIAVYYSFPMPTDLVSQGLLEESVKNLEKYYFEALLKYMAVKHPKGGCFIGRMSPNAQGLGILFIYRNAGAENGLPNYSSGWWNGLEVSWNCKFSSKLGVYSYKKFNL